MTKRLGLVLIILLSLMSTATYAYECGDYITTIDGGSVNPMYISHVKLVHNNTEGADNTLWEYQAYIIMSNGHTLLYAQKNNSEHVRKQINTLVKILNKCKGR